MNGQSVDELVFREFFEAQWAITRWLGVDVEAGGAVAVGLNVNSVVDGGVNYSAGGRLGVTGRILETNDILLSGRVEFGVFGVSSIVPRRLVDSVVNAAAVAPDRTNFSFELDPIRQNGRLFDLRPGLAFAAGVNRWVGFQASADIWFQWLSLNRDTDQVRLDFAGGVSVDFIPVKIPLTILAAGRLRRFLGGDEGAPGIIAVGGQGKTQGQAELAFFYSGRRNLDLGVALTSQLGNGDLSIISNIVMTYYW